MNEVDTQHVKRKGMHPFLIFIIIFNIIIVLAAGFFIIRQYINDASDWALTYVSQCTEAIMTYQLNEAETMRISANLDGIRQYIDERVDPIRQDALFVVARPRGAQVIAFVAMNQDGIVELPPLSLSSEEASIVKDVVTHGGPRRGNFQNWYGKRAVGAANALHIQGELYVLYALTDYSSVFRSSWPSLALMTVFMAIYLSIIALYVRYANSALRRESEESQERLRIILDHLDTYIYVSTLEDNRILLANKKLIEGFNMEQSPVGEYCWRALQGERVEERDGRCSYCPIKELSEAGAPEAISWEEFYEPSGHYFQNTDILLEWTDGKLVHMQTSVDITESKLLEQERTQQMQHQQLVTDLSLLFASVGQFDEQMDKALEMIARFFSVDLCYFMFRNDTEQRMECQFAWQSGEGEALLKVGAGYPLDMDSAFNRAMLQQRLHETSADEVTKEGLNLFGETAAELSGIDIPVFVADTYQGYLALRSFVAERVWKKLDHFTIAVIADILRNAFERNNMQNTLFHAEQTLRSVLDNIHMMVFWKDREGVYRGCNEAYLHYLNLSEQAIIGRTDESMMPWETAQMTHREDRLILNRELEALDEIRFMNVAGKPGWLRIVKKPIYDGQGEIVSILGVIEDITERRNVEIKVNDALTKLQAIISNYPGVICLVDRLGMISVFDGLGYMEQTQGKIQIAGMTLQELRVRSEEGAYLAGFLQTILDSSEDLQRSFEFRGVTYNCTSSQLYDEVGVNYAVLIAANDVSEMMRLQHDLEQAIVVAEQASSAKTDFLSRMSHEIRTPMNAIIGMTKIALQTDEMNRIRYALERISDSSDHLLGLINDILDMSKIEANKLELVHEPFNLEQSLQNVCAVISVRADEKNLNLGVHMSPDIPLNFVGDELRFAQVLTNLLSNAVKFTPEGGSIGVDVSVKQLAGKMAQLEVAVSDTGIGIAEDALERVFNSFEQAEGSTTRRYGGSGLGLSICKRIVELMGGNIWVESELGQGSTFRFTIRLEVDHSQERAALNANIPADTLRLMVIDDSLETREYFVQIMASFGIATDAADSGVEALRMLDMAAEQGFSYDVIFVDWRMPGMDGIETAKAIRQRLKNEHVIIIMISVAEWSDIEDKAAQAGIKRFVPKPLFPSALMNTINEVLGGTVSRRYDSDELFIPDLQGKTMLLVEDVEINREILAAVLDSTGIAIENAENGRIAVDMFEAHPERYDVIFMDIQMPEMDGYEATRAIRASGWPQAQTVPIIAMTANVFREDMERCLEAGMNDHLIKPVDEERVMLKLAQVLGVSLHSQRSEAEEAIREAILDSEQYAPYIDLVEARRIMRGNYRLYAYLMRSFVQNPLLEQLDEALDRHNHAEAKQMVHSLKGITANLALTKLYEQLVLLESLLDYRHSNRDTFAPFRKNLGLTIAKAHQLIAELEAIDKE